MSKQKPKPHKIPERVPGVQQVIGGPGPTIECEDATWRLGFNTQNAKARLEELIRAHVLREARQNQASLGGEEGEQEYQETRAAVSSGYYRTFETGWRTILRGPIGHELFALSLLQHHHPEATIDDVRSIVAYDREQLDDAVSEISPDFFAALAEQHALERKQTPDDARLAASAVRTETQRQIKTHSEPPRTEAKEPDIGSTLS